jgi:hypothetical protein
VHHKKYIDPKRWLRSHFFHVRLVQSLVVSVRSGVVCLVAAGSQSDGLVRAGKMATKKKVANDEENDPLQVPPAFPRLFPILSISFCECISAHARTGSAEMGTHAGDYRQPRATLLTGSFFSSLWARSRTQAVILADSYTRRMAPVTYSLPHALIPVANIPLIEVLMC